MEDMEDVWYPRIYVGNSIKIQSLVSSGADKSIMNMVWYHSPTNMLRYSVIFVTDVSCKLNFQTFPFDYHECNLILKNWLGSSYRVLLKSSRIYAMDQEGKEIGGKTFNLSSNDKLNYMVNGHSKLKYYYQVFCKKL